MKIERIIQQLVVGAHSCAPLLQELLEKTLSIQQLQNPPQGDLYPVEAGIEIVAQAVDCFF
jgi:hypothetical protein